MRRASFVASSGLVSCPGTGENLSAGGAHAALKPPDLVAQSVGASKLAGKERPTLFESVPPAGLQKRVGERRPAAQNKRAKLSE